MSLMKIIKEILGRIFAVWAYLCSSPPCWFLMPFSVQLYLPDPKKPFVLLRISRIWMGIYLPLIGCPLVCTGKRKFCTRENLYRRMQSQFTDGCTHLLPGIPGGNKTIAKIEMAKIPLFGMIYRTGSILVDRKSEKSRKESYSK